MPAMSLFFIGGLIGYTALFFQSSDQHLVAEKSVDADATAVFRFDVANVSSKTIQGSARICSNEPMRLLFEVRDGDGNAESGARVTAQLHSARKPCVSTPSLWTREGRFIVSVTVPQSTDLLVTVSIQEFPPGWGAIAYLCIALGVLVLVLWWQSLPAPEEPSGGAGWWAILWAVLIAIVVPVAISIAIAITGIPNEGQQMWADGLLGSIGSIATILALSRSQGLRRFLALGSPLEGSRSYIVAIGFALVFFATSFLLPEPDGQSGIESIINSPDTLFALFGLALFAPLTEELLYRGYLFGSIGERSGPIAAIIATSLLFVIVHVPSKGMNIVLVHTFGFGLMAGVLRWKSRSLAPCVVLHLVGNGLLVTPGVIAWLLT